MVAPHNTSPRPAPTGPHPVVRTDRAKRARFWHRYRPHHYLLMALGWPVVIAAAGLLYLRSTEVDRVYLIAAVALTPFLALALVPTSLVAWFSRSNLLRIATAGVVAVYLFTVAPFDAVIGCGPTSSEQEITIMTANIHFENRDPAAIARELRSADPDILFMQEAILSFLIELDEEPGLEPWGYRSHLESDPDRGVVVWSKWPMSDIEFDPLTLYESLTATVALPTGDVTLVGIHTTSPRDLDGIATWYRELGQLREQATDRPAILAGDFNATEDHAPFRQILDQGWTDVHDNKGCGLDQTWPTATLPFPVMRLDHVLVTDDFNVLSTDIVEITDSDHLAVITTVELAASD